MLELLLSLSNNETREFVAAAAANNGANNWGEVVDVTMGGDFDVTTATTAWQHAHTVIHVNTKAEHEMQERCMEARDLQTTVCATTYVTDQSKTRIITYLGHIHNCCSNRAC